MCFFVDYKYQGGSYSVWDQKRQVVVESRDIVFFEDSLPSPTRRPLSMTYRLGPSTRTSQ